MSKKVFDPRSVPLYPQTSIGAQSIDFDSETIGPNPYIMRARLVSKAGNAGEWSAIQMPNYAVDTYGGAAPWSGSLLYNQTANLDIGQKTAINWSGTVKTYVSSININLQDTSKQKYSTSGVKVWMRWIAYSMFEATPTGNEFPPVDQKTGAAYDHPEWQLLGVYNAASFTTAIPRWNPTPSLTVSSDVYFQILVTDNTTIRPNKYNYRWLGSTNPALTKVGEPYGAGAARGYLPWNPNYGQATTGNPWTIYMRQRSTLQDIAIFYPRKWQQ